MMLVLMMMTVNITFVCHIKQLYSASSTGRGHQLLIIIDVGIDHPEQQGYIYTFILYTIYDIYIYILYGGTQGDYSIL